MDTADPQDQTQTPPKPERPKLDPKNRQYWYESLAWLLREAPGLLGEQSNMGGVISALTSGGAGHSVASSDEHHEHLIDRLEHVARARELGRAFDALDKHSQLVLLVYYEPRNAWPAGCDSALTVELASVALAFAADRPRLIDACSFYSKPESKQYAESARNQASKLIADAHQNWNEVRRIHLLALARPQQRHASLDAFRAAVEAA